MRSCSERRAMRDFIRGLIADPKVRAAALAFAAAVGAYALGYLQLAP